MKNTSTEHNSNGNEKRIFFHYVFFNHNSGILVVEKEFWIVIVTKISHISVYIIWIGTKSELNAIMISVVRQISMVLFFTYFIATSTKLSWFSLQWHSTNFMEMEIEFYLPLCHWTKNNYNGIYYDFDMQFFFFSLRSKLFTEFNFRWKKYEVCMKHLVNSMEINAFANVFRC